jgi:hypothetical protein
MTRPITAPVRSDNRASPAKPDFPLSLAWPPSGFVLIAGRVLGLEGVVMASFASLPGQCKMCEKMNDELNQSKNNSCMPTSQPVPGAPDSGMKYKQIKGPDTVIRNDVLIETGLTCRSTSLS